MTFYIRMWVQGDHVTLIQCMEDPIGDDAARIVPSVVIDAEVEGPYMGANEVREAMQLEGTTLSIAGREIVSQEVSTREAIALPYEEAASEVRSQRGFFLNTHVDPLVSNPLRWADLTSEQQQAWADYRRALLDITLQAGFPYDIVWPTLPE